jgi:hypothetical protein
VFATMKKVVKQQLVFNIDLQYSPTILTKGENQYNKNYMFAASKNWLNNNFFCRFICDKYHQLLQQKT